MTSKMQLSAGTYRVVMTAPVLLAMLAITLVSHMQRAPQPELGIEFGDKVLHACAYLILGLLFVAALDANSKLQGRRLALWTLLFCAFFGLYDEIHQSFVPNRFADVYDWLADCLGGAIAALLAGRFRRLLGRFRARVCAPD